MAGVETLPAAAPAGFVKLPRALLLEPWAQSPACLALFIHLLAGANREAKEWQGVRVERGQLVTSRRSLAAATGISEQRVRTALLELSRQGATQYTTHGLAHALKLGATHEATHGFTLVTISNFDSYSGAVEGINPRSNPRKKGEATHEATQKPTTTREDIEKYIISLGLDLAFVEAFVEWLDYRHEIKKPLKGEKTIRAAVQKLRTLSGGSSDAARRIIQESIANGWQGLFELKDGGTARRTPSTKTAAARLQINKNDAFKTTFSK